MRELHELHVGKAILDEGVSLFPLWVGTPAVTGHDWSPGAVSFSEHSGGATVATLEARNASERPAIALEGDLAEGGLQHRMVARSLVLAPRSVSPVPALCVEQGRWHGTAGFARSGRRAAASVRAASRQGADAQSRVWQSIHGLDQAFTGSGTSSLLHHLDAPAAPLPRVLDGQRGVVIGIAGRILGAELYGSSAGLRSRWRGIVEGARLDARRRSWAPTAAETARAFTRIVEQLSVSPVDEAGIAVAVEGARASVRGAGIATSSRGSSLAFPAEPDRLLHLALTDHSHPLLVGGTS